MTDLARTAALAGVPARALVVARHRGWLPPKLDLRTAHWFAALSARGANVASIAAVLDEVSLGLDPAGLLVCAGRDAESARCRWLRLSPDQVDGREAHRGRLRVIDLHEVANAVEARLAEPQGSRVRPAGSRRRVRNTRG